MSAWDVTPGAVAPASVDLTFHRPNMILTLTEDDALALADAIRTELDRSRDLLHPGHGDTDPAERAS